MYLGEGAYGVEAAARAYYGKSAKDLTLDEAATIAGVFQTWRNAPTVNMERAKRRRGYVLQRMADDKYITQKEASEASARSCWRPPPVPTIQSRPISSKRCVRSSKDDTERSGFTRTDYRFKQAWT